jgi:hypothetical protein
MQTMKRFCLLASCLLLLTSFVFSQASDEKSGGKKKKKTISIYTGLNSNTLSVDEPDYSSSAQLGTHIGLGYRIGNFLYLQPGIRYSWSTYGLTITPPLPNAESDNLKVHRFGIPIQAGINVIPVANGLLNLRFFAGVEPEFIIDVQDNDFGYTKDDLNSTLVFGTLGAGLDITMFLFEIGYSTGFGDVIKNNIKSKPGQAFLNVGLRF